jgi:hypothetical protein
MRTILVLVAAFAVQACTRNDDNPRAALVDSGGAACPSSWTLAPSVDPTIAIPDGGGAVLMRGAATGTQSYTCTAQKSDGGTTYAWVFVGPEATLADCKSTLVANHFASDAGAAAPAWQSADGTYVIGKKLAAFTPDGGGSAVPWLLLQTTAHGGSGVLGGARYVQRLNTTGGVAPSATCDSKNVGATQKVNYTADYYFFGP